MIPSDQIIKLAVADSRQGLIGLVESYRRQLRTQPGLGSHAPQAEQLLAELSQRPANPPSRKYVHPEAAARQLPRIQALTQSDLMWIDRLPRDPAQVSDDDARTLAGMVAAIEGRGIPTPGQAGTPPISASDRRLIMSVWAPIKSFHDRNEADRHLELARQPITPVPPNAVDAIAEAISAEVPELTSAERYNRAHAALNEAVQRREVDRQQRLDQARQRIVELDAAAAARVVTNRTEQRY